MQKKGIVTALLTPFKDGKVDEKALVNLIEFQLNSGIRGFFVCGTTGLGFLMSVEERKKVAEVVAEHAKEAWKVVQVGSLNFEDTLSLAKHAEKVGAEGVACITPLYYKLEDPHVIRYYSKIASAISVPLLVYNIPRYTGYNIKPQLLATMAKQGIVKGIKDSSGNIAQIAEALESCPEDFIMLNGSEHLIAASLGFGAAGSVSALSNALPELVLSVFESYVEGDFKKANDSQSKVGAIRRALGERVVPFLYEILRLRGIDVGGPKEPIAPITEDETSRARSLLISVPYLEVKR